MDNLDIRWKQRLQNYRKALGRLAEAVELSKRRNLSELEQQGLVQAFEFTHELAWNTLKDFLEAKGAGNLYGSKDATREAFAKGLIENGEVWMRMIRDRNQSTHTYNEETVRGIVAAILAEYSHEFIRLEERLRPLETEGGV